MKKILFFIALLIFFAGVLSQRVFAFEFPIPELGNCRDRRECHTYCEIPAHKAACWSYSVYGDKSDVLAEESPEQPLKTIGITFPIAELGNCADVSACKAYCDIETNHASCEAFKIAREQTIRQSIQTKAKEELGCETAEACRAFCSQETNRAVCTAFAKKYHLKNPLKQQILTAAREKLSCTDEASCKLACEQETNHAVCEAISKRFNLKNEAREQLMEAAKAELGCTSFEACRAFCQDQANRDKCRNFGEAVSVGAKKLMEAGNCTTTQECRKYCEEHPNACPNFPKTNTNIRELLPANRAPGSLNSNPSTQSARRPELEGNNFLKPRQKPLERPQTETESPSGESNPGSDSENSGTN